MAVAESHDQGSAFVNAFFAKCILTTYVVAAQFFPAQVKSLREVSLKHYRCIEAHIHAIYVQCYWNWGDSFNFLLRGLAGPAAYQHTVVAGETLFSTACWCTVHASIDGVSSLGYPILLTTAIDG